MNALIEAIKEAQKKRELNDAQLAYLLGIDASYWSRLQSGERQIGYKLLKKLVVNMPELTLETLTYLSKNGG